MRIDEIIPLLKAVRLFRDVEIEALRLLAFSGTRQNLAPDDILFFSGMASEGGYLVLEGRIRMEPLHETRSLPLVYGRGVLIGQAALFAPIHHPATALALDNAMVLLMSRALMLKVLEAYPQSARAMQQSLNDEMQVFSKTLLRISAPLV